jgi:hypothetical protein
MQESQVKIDYLKADTNTEWLAYQRRLPKELLGKAKQLGLKGMLVRQRLTTLPQADSRHLPRCWLLLSCFEKAIG